MTPPTNSSGATSNNHRGRQESAKTSATSAPRSRSGGSRSQSPASKTRGAAHGSDNPASAVVERRILHWRVPVLGFDLEVPKELIPFYAGLGAMAVLEIIEWPLALVIAVGHTVASGSRNNTIRELGEGLESGA